MLAQIAAIIQQYILVMALLFVVCGFSLTLQKQLNMYIFILYYYYIVYIYRCMVLVEYNVPNMHSIFMQCWERSPSKRNGSLELVIGIGEQSYWNNFL